jgi:hypothetical protein
MNTRDATWPIEVFFICSSFVWRKQRKRNDFMKTRKNVFLTVVALVVTAALVLTGCKQLTDIGDGTLDVPDSGGVTSVAVSPDTASVARGGT